MNTYSTPPNSAGEDQNAGDWLRRNFLWIGAAILVVVLLIVIVAYLLASGRPKSPSLSAQALEGPKPTDNWYVCAVLGMGPVPDVRGQRLRFRLCHNDGWELLTYCLQPRWPPPALGATCTRLNENTYWCGEGLQNLREYGTLQTPVPTFPAIPTLTSVPTSAFPSPVVQATPTGTILPPTATAPLPTPTLIAATGPSRQSPGGKGFLAWLGLAEYHPVEYRQGTFQQSPATTPTPFQPVVNTPLPPEPSMPAAVISENSGEDGSPQNFYGIDFGDPTRRVRIKIYPPDRQVNGGEPIVISFYPGTQCELGDGRACIHNFIGLRGGGTTYISAHSGLGGEANAFRHALEGTGFDRARYSLERVQEKLSLLEGALVTISQGDVDVSGLRLVSVGRVPPEHLTAYMSASLPDALQLAAAFIPSLTGAVNPTLPQVVLETCGWRVPGEDLAPGSTSTSASIYLGVIQKMP